MLEIASNGKVGGNEQVLYHIVVWILQRKELQNERRSVVMRHGMYEQNSNNKYRTGFGNAYHARSRGI